ncbi:MAG: hypothetical protein JOZ41_23080 [Chloroflexi bacterium]|nr:hypothetical protein [Chloroflexota bacterium]
MKENDQMTSAPATDLAARFAVPRLSGTQGDDLVAWGLSILVAELAGEDVDLRFAGDRYEIEAPVSLQDLLEHADDPAPHPRLMLHWLASTEKKRAAPEYVRAHLDRDILRDDHNRLQEARRSRASLPQGQEAPAVVAGAHAERYPLYRALTSPGTQWSGYNTFVEAVQRRLLTPDGLRLILRVFDGEAPLGPAELEPEMKGLNLGKDRWRNPPGFLYPSLNKGPTMRLADRNGQTLGPAGDPDWRMADRGDRSLIELYLAYLGYFAVARVLDGDDGRAVLVPSPAEVTVPQALAWLGQASPTYSSIEDYLLATTSLSYADVALRYWQGLAHRSRHERFPQLLAGVHLALFWRPNANTFALRRQTLVPLPAWLAPLAAVHGYTETVATIETHRRHVRQVRGRWQDEKQLPSECREALASYVSSLSGDLRAWLVAVRSWASASRSVEGERRVLFWSTEDVRRIIMALDPKDDVLSIIRHDSFLHLAQAIRAATVYPQLDRARRQRGGGDTLAFDPDYELVTRLGEAADRHPAEFLEVLFQFAARYNDQNLRRNEEASRRGQRPRALIRTEDLEQMTAWVLADRRGLVPAALLAFGSSLPPRKQAEREADAVGVEPAAVAEGLGSGEDERAEQ